MDLAIYITHGQVFSNKGTITGTRVNKKEFLHFKHLKLILLFLNGRAEDLGEGLALLIFSFGFQKFNQSSVKDYGFSHYKIRDRAF